jgi:hypothetical protein
MISVLNDEPRFGNDLTLNQKILFVLLMCQFDRTPPVYHRTGAAREYGND